MPRSTQVPAASFSVSSTGLSPAVAELSSSLPLPTKMFQFRGLAHFRVTGLLPAGLSHSEILGSILVCKSPRLIAAYHVFLRLQEPRHPPYALYYFLTFPISPIVDIGTLSHLLKYVNERWSNPRPEWRIRESNP